MKRLLGRVGAVGVIGLCLVLLGSCASGSSPDSSNASTPDPKPGAPDSLTDSLPASLPDPGEPVSMVGNPFAERSLYAWPEALAPHLLADDDSDTSVLEQLARTPTGVWLLPEQHPIDDVGAFVTSVLAMAGEEVPVFVIYGIPGRDCSGGHSSGGLSADTYLTWVSEIASALAERAVVVLEPDAIATIPECSVMADRTALLSAAVDVLAPAVPTYLDGGHARWLPPSEMAPLLQASGVARVRGFAVNVSGYGRFDDEVAYAAELSALLDGKSFVIDTGRLGATSSPEWCNPTGALLGEPPRIDLDPASPLDAALWIKPPWESDGTCNGGPPAGEVWIERVLVMAERAGW